MPEMSLGDRLAEIRRRRSLTQEELAQASGVSLDVIRKLEQNRRDGAQTPTIRKLAHALEVKTSELFTSGSQAPEEENGSTNHILALRRILAPIPGGTSDYRDSMPLAELREHAVDITRQYDDSQFNSVLSDLPRLINSASAGTSLYDDDGKVAAYRILSRLYAITSGALIQTRHEDLAYDAIRLSMDAAASAEDDVLRASGAGYCTWIFLRQRRFDDAEEACVRMAEEIEPSIMSASPEHLSVWGGLLVGASAAATRNNRESAANDLLIMAKTAAARIAHDRLDYGHYWAAFGPTKVAIAEVENAMIAGDARHALSLAEGIANTGQVQRHTWLRHLLTVAEAQVQVREYDAAVKALTAMRQVDGVWLKNQRAAKPVVLDLLDAVGVRRARSTGLNSVASDLGVKP